MYRPHPNYLFIYGGYLTCFHPLAVVDNAAWSMTLQVSEFLLSVLGLHPKVEFLEHVVLLCLIFGGSCPSFSTMATLLKEYFKLKTKSDSC